MSVIIPNTFHVFEMTFVYSGSTRPVQFTCGGFSSTVLTPAALNTAWRNEFLFSAFGPYPAAKLPTGVVCTQTKITLVTGGLMYTDINATAISGSNVADPPSMNNPLIIQKKTGIAGRKYRGRMFVPYLKAESTINRVGIIDPSTVSVFNGEFDGARANLAGAGILMFLLHSDPLIAPTQITALVPSNKIGTMRRRLRGS